jgi:hypothetical protein
MHSHVLSYQKLLVLLGALTIHGTLNLELRHRWLAASHHWMPGCDLRVLNLKSVSDSVAVGDVFLSALSGSINVSPMLCTHIHSSIINNKASQQLIVFLNKTVGTLFGPDAIIHEQGHTQH